VYLKSKFRSLNFTDVFLLEADSYATETGPFFTISSATFKISFSVSHNVKSQVNDGASGMSSVALLAAFSPSGLLTIFFLFHEGETDSICYVGH
jgi:hypothetical protein